MHYLQHLLSYMLPIQNMIFSQEDVPAGFSRIITKRGNFVVTARSKFVIAKKYV